jgi:hypothetical protein
MLKADRVQSLIRDLTKHSAHNRQNLEIDDDVNFVLLFLVIDFRIEFFVDVVVVFSFAFAVSIVSFFVELITISFEIELFTMLVRRMIFFFADNAHSNDDDNDILNLWLRIWLNFVKKWVRDENDDDHDERWFFRNRAIDADIQKSIDRVIDVFNRVRLVRHDLMNLSIMLAILLELRVKIQMKIQNEKIIIDRHVDDHFSNVLHCHFELSSVIRDVLIVDESDDLKFDQQIV